MDYFRTANTFLERGESGLLPRMGEAWGERLWWFSKFLTEGNLD